MRKLVLSCLALIGLGLGGAVVAQTIGGVSNGYIEEGNLFRSGNIIKTITMSNRGQDATTCRKACDGDSDCNAYTYVQQSANRKPICYLRLIALPQRARRDHGYTQVVSGTKLSYLPDVHNITPYPGRAIQGAVKLRDFKLANQDAVACSDACYRDGNCASFTYMARTTFPKRAEAMCTLHSKGGTLASTTKPGILSGSKTPMSVGGKAEPIILDRPVRPNQPIIKRPRQTITLPDQKQKDENPSLSDDDDGQFPGEMLNPDGA